MHHEEVIARLVREFYSEKSLGWAAAAGLRRAMPTTPRTVS